MAEGASTGWLGTFESLEEFRVGPPSEGLRSVLRQEDALRQEEDKADGDSVADDDEGGAFEQNEMKHASCFKKLLPCLEAFLPCLEAFEGDDGRRQAASAARDAFASISRAISRARNGGCFTVELNMHADSTIKKSWSRLCVTKRMKKRRRDCLSLPK
jgi:hypothetical protein